MGYSNESGVRELVDNAGALMGEIELDAERQSVTGLRRTGKKRTPRQLMVK